MNRMNSLKSMVLLLALLVPFAGVQAEDDSPAVTAQQILAALSAQSGAKAAQLDAERARLDAKYRDRRD